MYYRYLPLEPIYKSGCLYNTNTLNKECFFSRDKTKLSYTTQSYKKQRVAKKSTVAFNLQKLFV